MTKLTEVFNDPSSRVYRVFFVIDIADSTGMKERDPEANWITTYGWFFDLVGATISEYHGTVVKYVGDGALAVFGENEATQAINAAIALQEKIRDENRSRLVKFACSVGIASGEARMFEVVPDVPDFIGSTVDRAFRLCGAANGNAIFVDSDTTDAANMNRVASQVGAALTRKTAEYRGPSQLVTLKGFTAPVPYYEIWWDRDRYGVSANFVTGAAKQDEHASATPPQPLQAAEKPTGEWIVGQVKAWRPDKDFGFVGADSEDFYFNHSYLFSATAEPRLGDRVVFCPADALPNAKNRRAQRIFVEGERIRGKIQTLNARGFGFAPIAGQNGATHQLFVLLRDVPEAEEGQELDFVIGHNDRGPVGYAVRENDR